MKKCVLMFGILILVLLFAVFSEEKQSSDFDPNFAGGEMLKQNTLLAQGVKDTIE